MTSAASHLTEDLGDEATNGDVNYTFADLQEMATAQLKAVFLAAPETKSLRGLDGAPACMPLSLFRFSGRGRLYRFMDSVWEGKSFQSVDDTTGTGHNRLRRGGFLTIFPFETKVVASEFDGRGAIALDYSQVKRNPWFERPTYDELREVCPGLFMGPYGLRVKPGRTFTMGWFAVDTRVPDLRARGIGA